MNILFYVLAGFLAQMVDGSLGMAYGVSLNSLLLAFGFNPSLASAAIHLAEVFTTGTSGLSHFKLGNVDKGIFKKLLIPGVIGGILGAYILTTIPTKIIKPAVSVYLLIMGIRILLKAFNGIKKEKEFKHFSLLALIGGFFDAIGGGGWGPIVTTTLISKGEQPRFTIGSVNASEFAVTLAESIVFILTLGAEIQNCWQIILGLLLGGMVAAPIAALVVKKIPQRTLLFMVGILISLLSIRTIILAF